MKFLRRVAPAVAAAVCLPPLICLVAGQDLSRNRSPRITQAVDENRLITLKGNTHPLARAEFDRGAARADLPMDRMLLVLKRSPEQDAALKNLLENQQVKSSPEYHHWLTPEQFGQRFGSADQDIQTVTFWLRSHGFDVNSVAKGRTVIEFSGNAGQVSEAFHTAIHSFVVKGGQHWANATDPRIPVALEPVVAGVATLNNFRSKPVVGRREKLIGMAPEGVGARPMLNVKGGGHALVPSDYAAIYNIKPLYQAGINGTGRTIAVVGVSNFDPQDVANFRKLFGASVNPPQIIVNGPDPGDLGGDAEMESVLDATWAGAIAPGATVKFVVSADTDAASGLDLSEQYIVDNNLGDVITESFEFCEAIVAQLQGYQTFLEAVREQAAAQGMTFVVSAGDSGAYNCDDFDTELSVTGKPSVNARAASPYVVAVGGTQFNEAGNDSAYWNPAEFSGQGSALSYIPENAWNQSCNSPDCFGNIVAGGGGPSALFPKPSWQSGIAGMPGDGARDLPDVSLTAASDHDAYALCFDGDCQLDSTGGFYLSFIGGTSAAAPSFAGMIALLAQKMNSRLGSVNPVLYGLAATEQFGQCNGSAGPPASNCIFNDVTQGNTGVPGEPGYGTDGVGYKAGQGYDLATGLGSVNLANLATQWSAISRAPTTTSLSISPSSFAHGSLSAIRVFVEPSSGTGVPTGRVSLLTSGGVALGDSALSDGSLSVRDGLFPGGSYTVTAHYPGDATFAPSDSPPVSVVVSPEVSKTTMAVLNYDFFDGYAPITSSPYGSFVYLSAGVAGASGAGLRPKGSITFLDNGTSIDGNPYLLNSSGGTLTLDGIYGLSVGQHSFVANYSGDPSYNAGASAPVSLVIAKASTFLSLDPKCVSSGTTTTVDANIDTLSLGDPPTGTVSFSAGGKPLGAPLPLSADWTASLPISLLVTGANVITANYSGDSNYLASTVTQPVIVGDGECVGSAVDGASYYPTLAPDELASIFGNALAAAPQYPASLQLPSTLAGTTVTVTDSAGHSAAAPLAFISPRQINCVIPPGLAPGAGTLQVTSSTTSDQMPVEIEKVAPAIFSADSSGFGLAAAQIVRTKPDGKQDTESTVTLDSKGNIIPVPVTFYADKLVLVLYATGVRHNSGLSNVRVFFKGQAKIPFYAGAQNQFEGLDQINVNLPPALAGQGPVDVYVTVDDQPSNDVTVVFK